MATGPPLLGVAAVAAAEEHQRAALVADLELVDPPDHDVVVTGLVDRVDLAVDPRQDVVDHRGPGRRRRPPADGGELVVALAGEDPADVLLLVRQHVHAVVADLGDLRVARRVLPRAERHERRIERYREERPDGETHRSRVGDRGDHGDPRREVPQYLPEPGAIDGRLDGFV